MQPEKYATSYWYNYFIKTRPEIAPWILAAFYDEVILRDHNSQKEEVYVEGSTTIVRLPNGTVIKISNLKSTVDVGKIVKFFSEL